MAKSPSELNTRTVRIGIAETDFLAEVGKKAGVTTVAEALRIALQQPVASSSFVELKQQVAELKQAGSGMSEQVECPDCKENVDKLAKVQAENKELARHKAINEGLERKIAALSQELERASAYPSVSEFVTHCESGECADHAAQWQAIKSKIVEIAYANIPRELVVQKGLELGEIPRRIVIVQRDK